MVAIFSKETTFLRFEVWYIPLARNSPKVQNMVWLRSSVCLAFLVVLSICDLRERRAPDLLTLGGGAVLLILAYSEGEDFFLSSILGSVLGFAVLLVARFATRGNLGLGDVKTGFLLGAGFGIRLVFPAFLAASISALLFAALAHAAGRFSKATVIPFVPFLGAGALATVAMGVFCPSVLSLLGGGTP
jgi:prepilin signal peptidase PulO-like enzyme (type II secretory pathway)